MNRDTAEQLEALHREIADRRAAVIAARDSLIEVLGDRMCGSGTSPSPKALRAFKLARQAEANAKARLKALLLAHSLDVIERARRSVSASRALPGDPRV